MKTLAIFFSSVCFTIFGCSSGHIKKEVKSSFGDTSKVVKSEKEWKMILDDETYRITREKGTERAFSGKYWDHHEKGYYLCVCCENPLFSSASKFNSRTGWPSFYEAIGNSVAKNRDESAFMVRTEAVCNKCDAHLGHVFDDGPKPTGLRYCINSASLKFVSEKNKIAKENNMKEATLGAGCFWCIEACFQELKGVKSVQSGYAGGTKENPTYEEVCTGKTGHAEVARIVYDESIITYEELLEAFWFVHDPTQLNRQGNDMGTQYRSVIFYHDEEQKALAEQYKQKLTEEKVWDNAIVTEITKLPKFYPAEAYHDNYLERNPENMYCQAVVRPKVDKFKKVFAKKVK